jgi:hypothetical protein
VPQVVSILVWVAVYAGVVYVHLHFIEPTLSRQPSGIIARGVGSVVHGVIGFTLLFGIMITLNVLVWSDYRIDALWPYGGLLPCFGGLFGLLLPWVPLLGSRTRRGFWLAVVVVVSLGAGLSACRLSTARPVPTFPQFDLGEEHVASYRVGGLYEVGPRFYFYLAIEDPEGHWFGRDAEIKQLTGSLQLQVLDGAGNILGESNGPLSDHVWGYWHGAHRLYNRQAPVPLYFSPKRGEEYTLRISYTADPRLAGFKGYGYLQCRA